MKNTVVLKNGLEVTGATLLTVEEAEKLPKETRAIGCWWWLRSPGHGRHKAANVFSDGPVDYYGYSVYSKYGAVRPTLIISLESSNLNIGDVFRFGEKDFKIISDTRALCTENIGCCAFRKGWNWKAPDANDYEVSDIRKFVEDWYRHSLDEERGLILRLPFMVGDVVYVRGTCDWVNMIPEPETGATCCPFEGKCEREECNEANSRIFETTVKSIWNEGNGWYFSVRNLYVDFPFSDVGRTVFLALPDEEEN